MIIILAVIILSLIGVDQLVKYWAVTSLKPEGSMDFIHFGNFKIFDLTYLENKGAIFGSMAGQRWFLIGFTSLLILAGIFILIKYRNRSNLLTAAVSLFVAGGIGNLIDRIRFGYVVDMFEFKIFKFAIFNVADIYVTFAMIILAVYILFFDSKSSKSKDSAEALNKTNE